MINPGEFNGKVKILTLSQTENMYQWDTASEVWAKAEPLKDYKLFPGRRSGAKPIKFTMRKCSISLNNAILWKEKHCFLTDITEIDRMYYEVTAVMLEPKACIASRINVSLGLLNRPVVSTVSKVTFPGCLLETYSKKTQGKPMSVIELRYLLAVPKVIELEAGQTVEIEGIAYEVWAPRLISEYKNEYEIRVRRDA